MVVLYQNPRVTDLSDLGSPINAEKAGQYKASAVELLRARDQNDVATRFEGLNFEVVPLGTWTKTEWHVLRATVPVGRYEELRKLRGSEGEVPSFARVARIFGELGVKIAAVLVKVQLETTAAFTEEEQRIRLSTWEIKRLVNNYIGVNGGYLGDFSYRSHKEFYEDIGLPINPNEYPGTTRERFISILGSRGAKEQAMILDGILRVYPPRSSTLRTEELTIEIAGWIERLRGTLPVAQPSLVVSSATVERALADAEALIGKQGATSAVDRAHTAFHGFLRATCETHQIQTAPDASITALLSVLREKHPALNVGGTRAEEVKKLIRSMGSIGDQLSTLRNNASIAHPNHNLLEEPEAMLAINTLRTLLHYIDRKLNAARQSGNFTGKVAP